MSGATSTTQHPSSRQRPVSGGTQPKVLVAGVGNIFLSDDGVGVEVVGALASHPVPPGVTVADFGIRGVHLAYELLEGAYDALVLVDAVGRGDQPGTVSVIEHAIGAPAPDGPRPGDGVLVAMDAHGMHPAAVLAMLHDLGGRVGQVLVVGIEVADVADGMGLSPPVAGAVPHAVAAVIDVVASLSGDPEVPVASMVGASQDTKEEELQ